MMRKLGIAAKLYLAFGSIFLLAVVASSIGWKGFQRVTDSQYSVIDQAIPGLRHAHQLSALNASIAAAAQQLLRARNETERLKISSVLFSEVRQVNSLLDDFQQQGFSLGSLQSLRETVGIIENKLHQQDELVRQRIRQQARFTQLAAGLIATTEELNDLADSLVANAAATTTAITSNLYDLVEDNASNQQLYNVFDRLVEVDLDAMERMYELRLRSANLNGLFNRVAKESELTELDKLRRRTAETISILKRRVSEINDPQRRQKATGLLGAMEVDNGPIYVYGIFETRVSLLQIGESLTQLSLETAAASQTLNGIVNELNAAGGTLINQVSTTAKESLDISRQLFGGISIILLLVAAAILWWFIKRNVVRRLLSLQSATHSITQGDYNVDIIVEGHDELTDMGRALRGFRNNAIHNRKLDEELREHKAHLEELVEKRSEQLRETNQMLSEEVQNHTVARVKAEQASEAKTAFLATMSHELRTPLSGALGTLRLLSDTALQAQQSEYVNIINAANASLLDIVNDILGYSQLEAGRLNIENRRFELSELINNVIGLMRVPVNEKNNCLILEMEPVNGYSYGFLGDSGKLHQILINLISNANKFTDNGSITLRIIGNHDAQEDVVNLQFAVIDTGIGIAKDKQEEIFQAFTQVDASSARRYGGIGLGLAICERLVNAMGGKILLESKIGEGTTIGFNIDAEVCRAVSSTQPKTQKVTDISDRIKVLMVEDDATNSMVTSNYLLHLGHQVIATQSGEEALSFLDEGGMALVLLDISLPGIDGLTILNYIRTHSDKTIVNLPVIAMSAHVFSEEVDYYLCAGMNGFLGKPFTLEDLEHAISQAMGGHEVIITNTYQPSEQSEVNPFDTSVVENDISRLGLDSVEKLAALFFQSTEQLKLELIEAMEQGNFETLAKLAHRMNGAAGNFGLQRLCALLARIETQANNGTKLTAALIEQFQVEFEEAIASLSSYLSKQKLSPAKLSVSP
ncbi:MAG: TMAO reductase system sensor histidine kinase/response regulator TorS [Gammaproteobacteria bacterium]|nr:TMAO reductase system sensor histidine kinase/response regulator TorS [Gammaproteobacteria bacterium]